MEYFLKTKNFLSIITIQILLLIILAFMYYAMNKHNEIANTNTFILIQILILLTLYPLIRAYLTKFYDLFEPIYIISFLYFLYFGLRAILLIYNPRTFLGIEALRTTDLNVALLYSIIGFGALLIGYYSPISNIISTKLPKFKRIFSSKNNKYILHSGIILIFLYIIGIIGRVLNINIFGFQGSAFKAADSPFLERLPYANLIVSFSTLSTYIFALYTIISFKIKRHYTIVALMAILEILFIFLGGWKSAIIPILFILFISYNYIVKKIKLRNATVLVILFIFIIILIFPVITRYRSSVVNIYREEGILSINKLVNIAPKIDIQYRNINTAFWSVCNRIGGIDSLIVLIKRLECYKMGETIFPIFSFFVPRVLWHSKPALSIGNVFAVEFLGWDPRYKSQAAVMQIGDLYWNFGIIGIIIGMFIFGVLYRSFYFYLIVRQKDSLIAIFFYVFCMLNFQNIEGNIAIVIAKLINTFIIIILILFIIILFTVSLKKEKDEL